MTEDTKQPFEVMLEMHDASLDALRPDNRIPDVDWAAKAILIKHGYSRLNYSSG